MNGIINNLALKLVLLVANPSRMNPTTMESIILSFMGVKQVSRPTLLVPVGHTYLVVGTAFFGPGSEVD